MRISFLFFVLGSAILTITGCKKDTPAIITNTSNPIPRDPPPPPPPRTNSNDSTPPIVSTGSDVFVFLPAGSCKLYGGAYSKNNGIESYMWRKISGPSSYKINSPDSFWTSVNDLVRGVYEFELTATDKVGLKDADTVSVTVGEMFSREITIKNIAWGNEGAYGTVLWGAILTLKNIYSKIPVGSVFKIFISNKFPGAWMEAIGSESSGAGNATYIFNIRDSNLYVWSSYEEIGTADIMIVY